jgi:hypothetical protein
VSKPRRPRDPRKTVTQNGDLILEIKDFYSSFTISSGFVTDLHAKGRDKESTKAQTNVKVKG